jgi:DNA-binding Lrp family transcriptional regulator
MLTAIEKKVIAAIQSDIPISQRPYLELAEKQGISEETFLKILENLCDRGVIRRFGATIRHQKSGFNANAMMAWKVDEDRIIEVGEIMASFEAVSHCYRRDPKGNWPYNLYTMVHAKDMASCLSTAARMSEQADVKTYVPLFSIRELKKTSMEYFADNESG